MKSYQKYLMFVLFLSFGIKGISGIKVEWSEDIPRDNFVIDIMGEDENGIFTLSNKKKDYFINNFNSKSLSQKYSKLIELSKQGSVKIALEEVFFMKNNVIAFASGFDKAASQSITYAIKYNKKTGNTEGKVIAVSKVDVEKKRRSGNFGFKLSENGEFLLIHHYAKLKKSDKQKLSLTIFDADLEKVKEIKDEFPFENNRAVYDFTGFTIDSEGNIFYFKSSGGFRTVSKIDLISHLFDDDYEERALPIEIEQADNSRFSGVSGLTLMANGEYVYLGGYYFSLEKGVFKTTGINGTFYSKIDIASNEVVNQTISEFDNEIIAATLSEKKAAKGKQIPAFYRIKDMILAENGELIIVSEYFTVVTSETQQVNITVYTYGNLIVSKISNEGEILWNKGIPKQQVYKDVQPKVGGSTGLLSFGATLSLSKDKTIYYSYLIGVGDENLYIVFNDNEKNFSLDATKIKKLTSPKKGVPAVVKITDDGEMIRKPGYEVLSEDVILRPKISRQVAEDEILVYGSKKKSEKIGRLIFE